MPKPVRKTQPPLPPELRQPPKEIFTPGYYCPECELRIDSNDLKFSARPKIWHDSCKPPSQTPARKKRICPGCGKRHKVPFGKSSSYCDEGCKRVYMAYFADKSGRKCFCDNPIDMTNKQARRMRLCAQHGFEYSVIHAMRPDNIGSYLEPHEIILEIKRLHVGEELTKLPPIALASLRSAEKVYEQRTWLLPGETELPSSKSNPLPHQEEEEDPFAP